MITKSRLNQHHHVKYSANLLFLFIFLFLLNVSHSQGQADSSVSSRIKIIRTWKLPELIKNISGIDYISSSKLACLQSEVGAIYIFDLETEKIEREIQFGPPGDYEGLALLNANAYIACADGRVLEVVNYLVDSPTVNEYGTHLTVDEHVTGICADKKNKRLLVSVLGSESENQHYKNLYAFNIATKRMAVKPAVRIDLQSRMLNPSQSARFQSMFQPSDLDINPVNGNLYVVDGTRCQLLMMRMNETIRDLIQLDREKFFKPEGITCTPSGEIFIAGTGERDEPGVLLQIRILPRKKS